MVFHKLFRRILDEADQAAGIRLLRLLLRLPARLFGSLVRRRNRMYASGRMKPERLPLPVISVGGLTVGGAGKTPVVRYLAGLLMDMGRRPAILSRGYGRTDEAITSVNPAGRWQAAGDEPAFLANMLPDVPIIVGADRFAAGRYAVAEFQPDILLLDDGFQHRRLHRDLDIVVLDSTGFHRNMRLLPAGPLREPLSALGRAHGLILTRTDQCETATEITAFARRVNPDILIINSAYTPRHLRRVSNEEILPPDHLQGQPALLFCGIANPMSFRQTVAGLGVEVASLLPFPDHHPFSVNELDRVLEAASRAGVEWIITTEKDAVRIPEHAVRDQLLALDISLSLSTDVASLKNLILSLDFSQENRIL